MRSLLPLLTLLAAGCVCGYGGGTGNGRASGCGGPTPLLTSKDGGDVEQDAGRDAGPLGCTLYNCGAMLADCRVELVGDPSTAGCVNVAAVPTDFDLGPYCVAACNAQSGAGALVQCIADLAPQCVMAIDAGFQPYGVVSACRVAHGPPLQACDDGCHR